ncbi:MAG: FtsX-like permease family protein [Dehalococcoidia bacterium]
MSRLAPVIRMVAQRAMGHRRLLLMVTIGVVLSSALMASVFLYSDAIRDLGLEYALRQEPQADLDLLVLSSSGKVTEREYAYRRETTDALLAQQAGDLITSVVRFGRSSTFFPAEPGGTPPVPDTRPRANIQFIDRLGEHTRLVSGRLPAPAVVPASGPPVLELLVTDRVAEKYGIQPGRTFDLYPHWRQGKDPVPVTITGVIAQTDPGAEYWSGRDDRWFIESSGWPTYVFFTDEKTYVEILGRFFPDMDGAYETLAMIDATRITGTNARDVEGRIRGLEGALEQKIEFTRLQTRTAAVIENYREKLFFTRLPLFALMLQIVGIVLFYLVMVASMVVERQTGEIALLKSRGASTGQVLTVFAIEAAAICGFAAVVGPFLAAAVIAVLGLTPAFSDLSEGHLLAMNFSMGAFGLSVLGALLAFAALVWPAYRACRFSITNYKQQISRPPSQPAFLRYYLDLAVLAVGAFAFYQLRDRGTLATEKLFGETSADPVLLAAPSLFIVMIALVFLRLFPVALRAGVWLSRSLNGPTIALGLTRMVRSPLQHSRLILLLILTTAVGVFAAGFRATLEQGYSDRAAYQAGAAARLEDVRKPLSVSVPEFTAAISAATGSNDVSPAFRYDGYFNTSQFHSESITTLALRSADIKRMAFWRGDFAGSSLDTLMDRTTLPPAAPLPKGVTVPGGTRFFGVWVYATNPLPLYVRLVDADGLAWEWQLRTESPAANAWQFYTADLSSRVLYRTTPPQDALAKDRTLASVFVRIQGNPPQVPEPVTMLFDDAQVTTAASLPAGWGARGFADGTVIDRFDDLAAYETVTGASEGQVSGTISRGDAAAGRTGAVARLNFVRARNGAPIVGLRTVSDPRPLPVIVDKGFLSATKKKVGDEFTIYAASQYVLVRVTGSFELFPGFDPEGRSHLLIADFDLARDRFSRLPGYSDTATPNAAWLGAPGSGPLTKASLLEKGVQVERVYDLAQIKIEQRGDPLVAASWEGILFLSFGAVLLLSALGFVTYSALSAQARSLEFAILRTMGFSGRQIIGVVTFEQCFVIVAGVAAGTLLGFPLGRLMIGYMGITEKGRDPLPPLISRVSWEAVATVYSLLGLVVVLTVAALVALYSRLAVSRALRMGEL